MSKAPPSVETPGENQPPANEPEQQAAAKAKPAKQGGKLEVSKPEQQAAVIAHGVQTHDEIVQTMEHGEPARKATDGRWVVPPDMGPIYRPDGSVTVVDSQGNRVHRPARG